MLETYAAYVGSDVFQVFYRLLAGSRYRSGDRRGCMAASTSVKLTA